MHENSAGLAGYHPNPEKISRGVHTCAPARRGVLLSLLCARSCLSLRASHEETTENRSADETGDQNAPLLIRIRLFRAKEPQQHSCFACLWCSLDLAMYNYYGAWSQRALLEGCEMTSLGRSQIASLRGVLFVNK
ncbi:hypothetical protein BDA96_04G248600 [Sorghum bicolor]|uniref:Uncharacterized protein n=1 Tax=Sorghum bicolor TaxID=4558 RepID=A0A921UK62_SORBI|nr:hypothetical protein BDA96_04G248600 [Sorghum bicolor]